MADEKNKPETVSKDQFEALLNDLEVVKAKLAAQEQALAEQPNYGEAVSLKKTDKVKLSGQTFKVGQDEYAAVYPKFKHNGADVTEAELLENPTLQKELVEGGFGVIRKIAAFLLFLLAFTTAQASTVTITAAGAEVVATGFTTREFYPLGDLLIITRPSTDAFEIQIAESRSKVWGGDIDSVTIAGASTDGDKWAFLCTVMLQGCTTNGYIAWMGRNDLQFFYKTSTSRVDVKYGTNRQPLWFGHIDSLKANRTSVTLAYMRLLSRYKAKEYVPSTSVATIAAGAAAGSSPTVSVTGDAYSGTISVTTGTTATTGTLATVTLKITATTGARVTLNATGNNSLAHLVRTRATGTTTTLVLTVPTTALSDATAYTWDYTVVPY